MKRAVLSTPHPHPPPLFGIFPLKHCIPYCFLFSAAPLVCCPGVQCGGSTPARGVHRAVPQPRQQLDGRHIGREPVPPHGAAHGEGQPVAGPHLWVRSWDLFLAVVKRGVRCLFTAVSLARCVGLDSGCFFAKLRRNKIPHCTGFSVDRTDTPQVAQ